VNYIATNSKYEYNWSFSHEKISDFDKKTHKNIFMPPYLNPLPAYNCFPAFTNTQSRKPNRGRLMRAQTKYQADFCRLMRAQTKYQADFCHSGTYLLSDLSRVILIESSELP